MIRHVVAMQLAASAAHTRTEHAHEIQRRLEALHDVNDGILAINVYFDLGEVATHWPVILVADCSTTQSLDDYQAHPRHRAVVEWMNTSVVSERAVVDYEMP
jgi:hypothetical protein